MAMRACGVEVHLLSDAGGWPPTMPDRCHFGGAADVHDRNIVHRQYVKGRTDRWSCR